jgi:hypothetical protein
MRKTYLLLLGICAALISCSDKVNDEYEPDKTEYYDLSATKFSSNWTKIHLYNDSKDKSELQRIIQEQSNGLFSMDINTQNKKMELLLGRYIDNRKKKGNFLALIERNNEKHVLLDLKQWEGNSVPSLYKKEGKIDIGFKYETDSGAEVIIENNLIKFRYWDE